MTDNEIMKALECCQSQGGCKDCPYDGKCCSDSVLKNHLFTDVFDLIRRQKAEIEKLEKENEKQAIMLEYIEDEMFPLPFENDFDKAIKTAKSEAIKEFGAIWHKHIDKVRQKLIAEPPLVKTAFEIVIDVTDNLVKEMTEVSE